MYEYVGHFLKALKISHKAIFKFVEFENGFLYSGLLLLLILKAEPFLISYPYQIFCATLFASTFLFVSFPKYEFRKRKLFFFKKSQKPAAAKTAETTPSTPHSGRTVKFTIETTDPNFKPRKEKVSFKQKIKATYRKFVDSVKTWKKPKVKEDVTDQVVYNVSRTEQATSVSIELELKYVYLWSFLCSCLLYPIFRAWLLHNGTFQDPGSLSSPIDSLMDIAMVLWASKDSFFTLFELLVFSKEPPIAKTNSLVSWLLFQLVLPLSSRIMWFFVRCLVLPVFSFLLQTIIRSLLF